MPPVPVTDPDYLAEPLIKSQDFTHGDVGQMIIVPDEVLYQRNPVAGRHAVAAMPALLDVHGGHRQNVPVPFASRETHPGVRRVRGRVRPSIHINSPILFVIADILAQRDQVLCLRVALFPNPQQQRAARHIGDGMNLALMFGSRQPRWVSRQRH